MKGRPSEGEGGGTGSLIVLAPRPPVIGLGDAGGMFGGGGATGGGGGGTGAPPLEEAEEEGAGDTGATIIGGGGGGAGGPFPMEEGGGRERGNFPHCCGQDWGQLQSFSVSET